MDHVWKALSDWAVRLGVLGTDPDPTYSILERRDGLK